MPKLVVNVDHIATLRQARLGKEPNPVTAAVMAELAGACGIIVHLREDRRHIQDSDVRKIRENLNTELNLEMAATKEMQTIALDILPEKVCLVPEKRQELTTEGGLDCAANIASLKEFFLPIHAKGIRSSLFIDADKRQIDAAKEIGAEFIEIHTGHFADAPNHIAQNEELKKIITGIEHAKKIGLKVNLGHGLNYTNIFSFADIENIYEYSIGHSIMARAVFVGLDRAVGDMVNILAGFAE